MSLPSITDSVTVSEVPATTAFGTALISAMLARQNRPQPAMLISARCQTLALFSRPRKSRESLSRGISGGEVDRLSWAGFERWRLRRVQTTRAGSGPHLARRAVFGRMGIMQPSSRFQVWRPHQVGRASHTGIGPPDIT